MAGKGQAGGLEVDFHRFGGDVGSGDCEVNVVAFRVVGGRALGPED